MLFPHLSVKVVEGARETEASFRRNRGNPRLSSVAVGGRRVKKCVHNDLVNQIIADLSYKKMVTGRDLISIGPEGRLLTFNINIQYLLSWQWSCPKSRSPTVWGQPRKSCCISPSFPVLPFHAREG